MPKRSFGFSIVELLIAVSILSVLTAIGATVYKGSSDNSQDQARLRDFSAIKQGLELYRHSERSYPKELKDLVKYLDPIPTDPETSSSGKQYAYAADPATCTSAKRNCKAYVICAKKKGDKQQELPTGCKNLSCAGTTGDCDMGITSDEPYGPIPTTLLSPTPTPTATPRTAYRVFVTSTTYNGNLKGTAVDGLAGADAKCQERADAARLTGTYKAWLSTSDTSASSRLYHSPIPYKLVDGMVIDDNWDDLTKEGSALNNPIYRTEQNVSSEPNGYAVWTGTSSSGEIVGFDHCLDWTSASSTKTAPIGHSNITNFRWTFESTPDCSNLNSLYCFEQP